MDLLSDADVDRLRDDLVAAGYHYEGVAELLGPVAHRALSRNETTPGLRATSDRSPLSTLTRLWLLQAPVPTTSSSPPRRRLRRWPRHSP